MEKYLIKNSGAFIEFKDKGWACLRDSVGASAFNSEAEAKEALINQIVAGGDEKILFIPKGGKVIIQHGSKYIRHIKFNSIMADADISNAIEFNSIQEAREALLDFVAPEFVKVNA